MENTHFQITSKWLNDNRTAKGAFTRAQIQALGIGWPPRTGWIDDLVGELITSEQALNFENGKDVYSSKMNLKHKKIMKSLDKLTKTELISIRDKCNFLLTKGK